MSNYRESTTINAPADSVFEFVCEPSNMPQYLPTVHQAQSQGPGRIRMKGEAAGHPYDSDGNFRTDDAQRRMEWGSDGENMYRGWLEVRDSGQGCELTVNLDFEPRPDQEEAFRQQMGSRDATIKQGLRDALQSIKNICEGKGGKVPSPAETNRGYAG